MCPVPVATLATVLYDEDPVALPVAVADPYLFARTEKLFFASSSAAIASLEEQRGQNERICNSMRPIFSNGWDK
jgi:hypothetical protein